jgi:hypothetical protein
VVEGFSGNPYMPGPVSYVWGEKRLSPNVPRGKRRMDVYLTEDEEKRFRETVFKRKGMKKGNISEAVQEAVLLWINTEPSRKSTK